MTEAVNHVMPIHCSNCGKVGDDCKCVPWCTVCGKEKSLCL